MTTSSLQTSSVNCQVLRRRSEESATPRCMKMISDVADLMPRYIGAIALQVKGESTSSLASLSRREVRTCARASRSFWKPLNSFHHGSRTSWSGWFKAVVWHVLAHAHAEFSRLVATAPPFRRFCFIFI